MERVLQHLKSFDQRLVNHLELNSFTYLRGSIGIVYILFGLLKFFPNYSPAEELATITIELITFNLFSGDFALISLAIIECSIGLGLLLNIQLRLFIWVALWHMLCTFFPLFLLPEASYTTTPMSLSLVGQYILKNLIIITALLVIYVKEGRNALDKSDD